MPVQAASSLWSRPGETETARVNGARCGKREARWILSGNFGRVREYAGSVLVSDSTARRLAQGLVEFPTLGLCSIVSTE